MLRVTPRVVEIDEPEWVGASPQRPCPVCAATDGCRTMASDDFVCCLRIVCDWPVVTGGWLHRLDERGASVSST